jgi:hypothetical protein
MTKHMRCHYTKKFFLICIILNSAKGDKMEKYYFVTYITRRLGKQFFDSSVIAEHPFSWLRNSRSESILKMVLVGWREISKDEYEMYIKGEIPDDLNQSIAPQSNPIELISGDPSEGLES